jgi:signal peptidase I
MKTVGGKYYYIVVCLWFVWTVLAAGAGKNLVAGIKYFVMTTDSMAPTIPSGSIVVVNKKKLIYPEK